MALSEVFTSLQQGTIEAQENPLAMIETQSFYEVCPYLILTAHLRAWVYIAMGLAQYNRLSDSQKAVVDQAGAECQAYEHELFLDNEEKYYNQLQEQGMEFIEVDTDAFANGNDRRRAAHPDRQPEEDLRRYRSSGLMRL